ncbi:MAG: uncharacterized protein JWN64_218 [Parcubacteria group bacterium]|nr:uncharacterized protein [Parcubacteria group bacterium]
MPRDKKPKATIDPTAIERVIASIGSVQSLLIHTVAFAAFFSLALFGILEWSLMLLILTTILSLEAIYLAIFIQITVNRHTESLREVEEDIDEIQEDVEELGEDMGEIQEDIEEISEDIDEIQEDVEELSEEETATLAADKAAKKLTKVEALEQLSKDVQRVLADLEALKEGK